MADRDRFFYAWLKDLGIEKGKPFNPTIYQKEILFEGVKTGMAMAQATAFNKTKEKFTSSLYGNDSGWEDAMAGMDPNPPAALFWSITVYDIANRLIIQNDTRRSDLSSRSEALVTNTDGSVDLYFGPEAPKGNENNWIQSNKGQSFFVYLRLYGPEQAYFDQTFPMNKIEKIK